MKTLFTTSRLWHHTDKLEEWKQFGDTTPIVVEFGITNDCNHKCFFCSDRRFQKQHPGSFDWDVLKQLLIDFRSFGVRSVVWEGGGEPLLYPHFTELLELSFGHGLSNGILTNGSLIIPSQLVEVIVDTCDFVRISLDAGTSKIYETMHSVNEFHITIAGMKALVDRKRKVEKKLTVGASMLIHAYNQCDIVEAANICRDCGIDYIEYKPLMHRFMYQRVPGCEPYFEEAKKYETADFKVYVIRYDQESLQMQDRKFQYCYAHRLIGSFTATGHVFLCCSLKDQRDKYCFGRLDQDHTFMSIWRGEKRAKILELIESDPNFVNNCKNCRLDPFNEVMNVIKDPPHQWEFI